MDSFIDWEKAGVMEEAFWRYVREQIFSLPGVDNPDESFSILLTGSRAIGTFTSGSDVDINVVCTDSVFRSVHRAGIETGRIKSPGSFFLVAPEEGWEQYFGAEKGRPHFSITAIEDIEKHVREFEDVPLWIWTHAKVLHDPFRQFGRVMEAFDGYPRDVLVRKIKYHVLMAWYWDVDVYPHHASSPDRLLAASSALLNGITELLRAFFLFESKPYPYTEQLWPLAGTTRMGRDFLDIFQRAVDLITGHDCGEKPVWNRLDEAAKMLFWSDYSEECRRLDAALDKAMLDAGVEPEWVAAGYGNIDELLSGSLGPPP